VPICEIFFLLRLSLCHWFDQRIKLSYETPAPAFHSLSNKENPLMDDSPQQVNLMVSPGKGFWILSGFLMDVMN
jgi:hypothetical protein